MQALSVKAYHSALAKHYGSKLNPALPANVNRSMNRGDHQAEPELSKEKEYHRLLVQYCRKFVSETVVS